MKKIALLIVFLAACLAASAQEPAPAPAPARRLVVPQPPSDNEPRQSAPAPSGRRTVQPAAENDVPTYIPPAQRRVVQQPSQRQVMPKEPTGGPTTPAPRDPKSMNTDTKADRKLEEPALNANFVVPVTDYSKIIIPEDSVPTDFEERLVQTAWRNLPTNRAMESKLKQSQEYLNQMRKSWFSEIVFFGQTNFTDYGTGNGQKATISATPTGLGVGLSFTLAQWVNYASRMRSSREGVNIARQDLNYQKHFMRSETLKRYQSYAMYKSLFKSQLELANEQEMTLKVMKLNFETGQVPVEEFAKIQKAYADAAQLVITSKHNMFSAKAYLEEWIGVKLEEVR